MKALVQNESNEAMARFKFDVDGLWYWNIRNEEFAVLAEALRSLDKLCVTLGRAK